uniref:Uncharacterized protein n=1 Tax=Trypanosoma vivax (strain Y486) TaxID=1055687 RepID=G0TSU3_TRYVY|nr:conserved hypothetical protein, fragment [Trypanosoma vivax Y486]
MHVFPERQQCNTAEGGSGNSGSVEGEQEEGTSDAVAVGSRQDGALEGVSDFLARLRGPPQKKLLLLTLIQACAEVENRNVASTTTSASAACSTTLSTGATTELLNFEDLCAFIMGNAPTDSSLESGTECTVALSLLASPRYDKLHAFFSQYAKVSSYRRRLLVPLLQQWLSKGKGYTVIAVMLLNNVIEALRDELFKISPFDTTTVKKESVDSDRENVVVGSVATSYESADRKGYISLRQALEALSEMFMLSASGQRTPEQTLKAIYSQCADISVQRYIECELSGETGAADDFPYAIVPVQFPAPCGALLLISVYRTLSKHLMRLRTEWEHHVRMAVESESDYIGRSATFCTTDDIVTVRGLVQLVHRMVFGFQLQSVGLLRLWLSYLTHLFVCIVPPPTDEDELVLLHQEAGGRVQAQESFPDKAAGSSQAPIHSFFRRSPNESPQGELRAVLGELLADLALMSLVDENEVREFPSAIPYRPGSAEWLKERNRRTQDVLILQHVFPIMLLEEMCVALRINVASAPSNAGHYKADAARKTGAAVSRSFLGTVGLFAFCQRLELFIVPDSFENGRIVHYLQTLWNAVELANAAGAT